MQALIPNFSTPFSRQDDHPISGLTYGLVKAGIRIADTISARVRDWQTTRRGILEMQALSNHLLQDIGVQRSEIESVVRPRRVRRRNNEFVQREIARLTPSKSIETPDAANDHRWNAAA